LKLDILNPAKKLKASYQRLHIDREKIELFKENIKQSFQDITIADKKKESEEHYKAIVRDFLLDTYYKGNHSINTQGRNDLVIHNGSNATSPVGIIIETKQPTNKAEMISAKNPNSKSFQQLITYFLKERFENKNLEIKHLIISNIYEWYIFDASDFERYFYDNKKIKDSYLDWTNKTSLMSKTDWFYKEVLFPHIEENLESIPCTYFNLKEYQAIIENDNQEDDEALLDLYKILSSEHLLKKQIVNDSNSLNKQFYAELLHILGLEEVKEGSKKTIKRCAKPNEGSILENTLAKLKTKARDLSETEIYDTALELTITWLNRILFLKLLEGQLIKYNNNADFAFLNYKKIDEYDILEELFFEVLAVNYKDRPDSIQNLYANIPYLNSSLFEETELERKCFGIGLLKDRLDIPIYANTVLDFQVKGSSKRTLEYLFEFLDAYDFSDDTKGKIKEESKTIINASVLGLIFEKINGYKDGSFFTPSFITMYMCRESIRRAVVQKFNDTYGWKCEEFTDLKNEIKSIKKKQASDTINTLRICDPAVGSGHFLVSALNEMISIKQDLKILIDKTGEDFSEYSIEIENDELIIKDEKGNPYSYNVSNKESRRIQETLFNEKQTIIENCLFGVDINPKSVMICRLRLWIELLKNAYYTDSSKYKELETLPNIDINIKCGNSLISKFEVKDSVFESIPNFQTRLKEYTTWVQVYKGERDKSAKAQLVKKIDQFKSEFKLRDKRTDKVQNEMDKVTMEILKSKNPMFPLTDTEKAKVKDYEAKLEKLTQEKKDIESNPIYQNAFEWRFEFPEVLNDKGEYIGFDVVIGNPPYIRQENLEKSYKEIYLQNFKTVGLGTADIYVYFYGLALNITKENGCIGFITLNKWLKTQYGANLRNALAELNTYRIIDFFELPVFEEASTDSSITFIQNKNQISETNYIAVKTLKEIDLDIIAVENKTRVVKEKAEWKFIQNEYGSILSKMESHKQNLEQFVNGKVYRGITTGFNKAFIIDNKTKELLCKKDPKSDEIIGKYFTTTGYSKINSNWKNEWFLNTHNGVKSKNINPINVEKDYIEIFNFLCKFLPEIDERQDKGIHWSNLRNCAYIDQFRENKIIYTHTAKNHSFYFDTEGFYINNSCYMIVTDSKFLWGFLNSRLFEWYKRIKFVAYGDADTSGRVKLDYNKMVTVPIPDVTGKMEITFSKLYDKILSLKKQNPEADTSDLEAEIDKMVYELYGLSEEEVRVVEGKN
jgi:adenine-specific DNA-methyltransferase